MTKASDANFDASHVPTADGPVTVVIPVMPEQLLRFQFWADQAEVPLDRFMREAAELVCVKLSGHLADE